MRQCRALAPLSLDSLLSSQRRLQVLLCDGCTSLEDQDLATVAQLTSLTRLSLSSCQGIQGCDLHRLAQLPRLKTLSLCSMRQLDDQAVASLAGASTLQILRLDCCPNLE